MIEYADTSMFTPNLVLKSTKKFLSGLFLLLFVKPPHSSTMHSIGESLVQKSAALDRCKDFKRLSDQNQVFQQVFVWWSSSTMGTAFRDDVMKWPWKVELLPPFRRVLGRMLAILRAKHFGFPTLLKGAVLSEYAQYLFFRGFGSSKYQRRVNNESWSHELVCKDLLRRGLHVSMHLQHKRLIQPWLALEVLSHPLQHQAWRINTQSARAKPKIALLYALGSK